MSSENLTDLVAEIITCTPQRDDDRFWIRKSSIVWYLVSVYALVSTVVGFSSSLILLYSCSPGVTNMMQQSRLAADDNA